MFQFINQKEPSFKAIQEYDKDKVIYDLLDPATDLFIVLSGRVAVFQEGALRMVVVREVGLNEVFGQHQILKTLKKRQHVARAVTATIIQRVSLQPKARLQTKNRLTIKDKAGWTFQQFSQCCSMLKGLSPIHLKPLFAKAQVRSFTAKQRVYQQLGQADSVFLIVKGVFGLYKNFRRLIFQPKLNKFKQFKGEKYDLQQELMLLDTVGSFFGLESVIGSSNRFLSSAICEEPGVVFEWSAKYFLEYGMRESSLPGLAASFRQKSTILSRQFKELVSLKNNKSALPYYHFGEETWSEVKEGKSNLSLKQTALQFYKGKIQRQLSQDNKKGDLLRMMRERYRSNRHLRPILESLQETASGQSMGRLKVARTALTGILQMNSSKNRRLEKGHISSRH